MEKILRFSIYHRYLIIVLTFLVSAYGFYSFKKLPIDAVPDITNNQVQINTIASGFSPYDVEKQITFPLENALLNIPGLEMTRSISRSGFSQVTAIFKDNVDIYFARSQINEKLSEIKEALPGGIDPKMGPISTGLGEVYMWNIDFAHPQGKGALLEKGKPGWQKEGEYLTSEGLLLKTPLEWASYLRTVQDWIIKPQLKTVSGIAGVDSIGGFVRQYHIMPLPQKMIALGVSFSDLKESLQANNTSVGAGYIEWKDEAYIVNADNRVKNLDEIGRIVVSTKEGGVPIHISDVAEIGIGEELRTGSASKNGSETVIGTALMLIGANSRTVSSAVHEKLEEISKNLPSDIIVTPLLNRTKLVNETIHTVFLNLSEGAVLVILVIFLMLHNFRAALITASVIPLSMLMTAIGMVKFKMSGNLMSLGALDFGLIVDGAIIITENCLRRLSERQHHFKRTLSLAERLEEITLSSKEMIQPTIFGQAIIIIVYIPILAFSGIEGKMFHPMALTVIFALAAAFILSITFVPAMISIIVSRKVREKEPFFISYSKTFYQTLLEKILKRPLPLVLSSVVIIGTSSCLFFYLGQEFVPTLDEKDMAMQAMRIPSTSLTQSSHMQLLVEKSIASQPEVDFVFSKTGTAEVASDPMPPHLSDTFIILKPKELWPNPHMSKNALIENLEKNLETLAGNKYEFTQPIEMRFNELIAGTRGDLAIKIYGDDYSELERLGTQMSKIVEAIPGAEDIKITQAEGQPTFEFHLNYNTLSRLGLKGQEVLDVISTAVGGEEAGVIFEGDKRFDILLRLPPELRNNKKAIESLPILLPTHEKTHSYSFVPLKDVASITMKEGINEIRRENGKRVFIVEANVRNRDLGSFVKETKKEVEAQVKLPPGYWLSWGGQFENLESARAQLLVLIPLCFLVIFFLLYTALRSIKLAFLVFMGIPLAITGGILAIWIREIPFSISASVGFIALSGIAVLNGLVMVTCISQLIKEGMSEKEAIIEGAVKRLRPVLMTALVASLGFIPMAISTGTGSEVQRPLATVVIGGLISSTVLTLFITPLLYAKCIIKKKKKI